MLSARWMRRAKCRSLRKRNGADRREKQERADRDRACVHRTWARCNPVILTLGAPMMFEHVSSPSRVIDGVAQQMEIDRQARNSMLREVVNSQNATIAYLRAKKQRANHTYRR